MVLWKYYEDRDISPINNEGIDLLMNMLVISKSSLSAISKDLFDISTIAKLFDNCRDEKIVTRNEKKIKRELKHI